MYLRSVLTMTQLPRFFEARARLMQSPDTSGNVDLGFYREIGPLYNPFTPASSIRLFILGNSDSNNLIVRARDGDGPMADVDIDPDPDKTRFHVFRIEWEPEVTRYYINGALQATILSSTQVVTSWVFLYHQTPSFYGSTPTDIDWVRAGQYVGSGTYTSCPQDVGQKVRWDTLAWDATVPSTTTLAFRVRTSMDGANWSDWSDPLSPSPNNIPPALAFARYLQYRVEMSTTNPMWSPEVREVVLSYSELADLTVRKEASSGTVLAGNELTYTIWITNSGPLPAQNVRVTDTLPGGMTWIASTPSQGTCTTLTCDLGILNPGGVATVNIRVRVNSNTSEGTLANQVIVGTDTPDDPANNTATVSTAVQTQADLSLTLRDEPDPVVAGTLLTYTLTLTNAGPSDAQGVVLTLTLPISWQVDGFTPISGCSLDGNRIICAMGTMPAEAVQTLLVTGTVPAEVPEGMVLIAQAEVRAGTPDANSGNNEALASTEVRGEADLQLLLSGEPDLVFVGEVVTYTLALTNTGPSLAPGVQVTFTLPDGVQVLDATPSSGSCVEASCALGDLPVGENATVRLRVRVERWTSPEIRVRVEAVSRAVDPTPASAEVRTQVRLRLFLPLVMRGG
jgi:uncharacterized repeat protein (TIGR01451 family)